jgi:non-specific serine/threonine protein kinase
MAPRCRHDGAERPLSSVPAHLEPRDVVGRTSTATLWRARDHLAGSDVVIKVLHGPLAAARVESEARALARLGDHPHVLALRAVGVDGEAHAWVVTALASVGSLLDVAPANPVEVRRWVAQVADALAHAHGAGVVHGDVTPANVLLDDLGTSEPKRASIALLADFGSSTVDGVGAGLQEGSLVGCTPAFAAPERCGGAAPSPAGDVYGLARTALEVVPGRRLTGFPRGIRRLLGAALHPDPRRRPTAEVVHRSLR